ncbi:hypothetical protein DOTSEDRAFT_75807 [Dothistroma septosporum NZE10]|uniref:Uncharacterized protein n=1 Tax=Dothistroma septosporum (strain NZE10 / CBS 128990) TaxID=675120 RepID=N1PBR1_DOTSN|nr:hypothetical protein DOTSEDRAFT_75807 [Dothistroma septosporum NZE10]
MMIFGTLQVTRRWYETASTVRKFSEGRGCPVMGRLCFGIPCFGGSSPTLLLRISAES